MAELDRLIDQGLNLYGSGDLDGALAAWEDALAIDPENAQATSYVEYVRQNYDLLATDGGPAVGDAGVQFGIEDEPEYVIEISPGEIDPGSDEPSRRDTLDEGWFIDDEDPLTVRVGRGRVRERFGTDPPQTLEMEADEPPLAEGLNFDDATREYVGLKPPPEEFAEEPSSFRADSTPLGFGAQETEIKKRNTGFVQPVPRPKAATHPVPVPSPGDAPLTTTAELHVRVRTPSSAPPPAAKPAEVATAESDPGAAGREVTARLLASDDLFGTLSMPRKVAPARAPIEKATTRDLPGPRPPAAPSLPPAPELPRETTAEIALATSTTRDLAKDIFDEELGVATTRLRPDDLGGGTAARLRGDDLGAVTTRLPMLGGDDLGGGTAARLLGDDLGGATSRLPVGGDDPMIGLPTRELGLRLPDGTRAPSVYPDEDATTTQSDARQIRREAAERGDTDSEAGTRQDIVLPFDPIDARSAQILEEIDTNAPAGESKEDHVRRRISELLARAAEWNAGDELDKAVTAVDLALSEDPTSALAQKLVHRNRDAIMAVFQSYLGDLERQPQLAKPLHELAAAPISPRAAFLLSRIDGMLSIDEILDVSGMPRLEAYRHLCQLFLRGILR